MKKTSFKKIIIIVSSLIFVFALIVTIVSGFFQVTLKMKPFYKHDVTYNDEKHLLYEIDDNNDILMLGNVDEYLTIYRIKDNDNTPKIVERIKTENTKIKNYSFKYLKESYYIFYDNNLIVGKIGSDYTIYNNVIDDFIYGFDSNVYSYLDYTIYQYNFADTISKNKIYDISKDIINIKNVDILSNKKAIISTYESKLYYYDLDSNEYNLISPLYNNYIVNNDTVYYVYYDNDKQICGVYNQTTNERFKINRFEYNKIIYADDYLYFLNENTIYKISIRRKKQNETIKVTGYNDYIYNLKDILIVNDKQIYLPVIYKDKGIYYNMVLRKK